MDSLSRPQCGQRGESILSIRCRYVLSGTCLVRSCVTRLACALPYSAISFRYLFDGMVGSILVSLGNQGEQDQQCFHRALSSHANFCFIANGLIGSGSLLRKLGRTAAKLVLSVAAALASASA